ncbi:MAG TPA: DegV family protein, partial [Anaerolineaceae bacterium]|nr:DegV family protein [Anaerolineaceae bacterium]
MQIVTDRGMDLANEQFASININQVPLLLQLDGKTYRSGVDISSEEFYHILDASDDYPTTSQPSAGDFAELYRDLAMKDPE